MRGRGSIFRPSQVWPPALQHVRPGLFDSVFAALERVSPPLRGFANHSRWEFGVSKPHELLETWRPFNIRGLAPQIQCPVLFLVGEGEYEQTDAKTISSTIRFIREISGPIAIHEFEYRDGWAASHCSVGDIGPANAVIFDWLERTVIREEGSHPESCHDWRLLRKYNHNSEIEKLLQDIRVRVV